MKAISTPNIALIKYWGNRDNRLRIPAADSVSITLNAPTVTVDVEAADVFIVTAFDAENTQKILTEKDLERWRNHFALIREYLASLGLDQHLPSALSITIHSAVPPRIGLASSAAVFSAFAKAIAGLIADSAELSDLQVSILARLGSGSAARSIFGGFTAIHVEDRGDIDAAYAVQIADENHWQLWDVIIVPSHDEKKVGSTEGHAMASTSPMFEDRLTAIRTRRQQECIDAILEKDFERLRAVTEEDCWDMHQVMQSQNPPLNYLSDETHRIVKEIEALREKESLDVLYTMDAGPTVHLICTSEAHARVLTYAHEQAKGGSLIFDVRVGGGTSLVD